MTNLKVLLLFALLSFLSNIVIAQNIIYSSDNDNENTNFNSENNEQTNNSKVLKQNKQKISYNINVGSTAGSIAGGSFLNLYTAPKINFKFTPKVSFSTGFIFMNTSTNINDNKNNTNQSILYNSIDYKASERLKISGEILYGMNNSAFDNSSKNTKDYYVRFSAEYKITKNLSFGINISRNNSSFYNPFATSYYNPFYNNDQFSSNMFGGW